MIKTELIPPPLPDLRRQNYSIAAIGAGVGTTSTLLQLARCFEAFYTGDNILVGQPGEFVSFQGAPCPPTITATTFAPTDIAGVGWAYESKHTNLQWMTTNTPIELNGLELHGDNRFERYGWGEYEQKRPVVRPTLGRYHAWRFRKMQEYMDHNQIPFSTNHIKGEVRDVEMIEEGDRKFFQIDIGHGLQGRYDSLLVSPGHEENPFLAEVSSSPRLIRNFYVEYDKFINLMRAPYRTIVLAGFASTSHEVLSRLIAEGFQGNLIVIATGRDSIIPSAVMEGRGHSLTSPHGRYLRLLFDANKFTFIDGRVVGFEDKEGDGEVSIEKDDGGICRVDGSLIIGAPFRDGVDEEGRSYNRIVRLLQDKGYLGNLRKVESRYTDEFGMVSAGRSISTIPPIFLAGRVANAVPRGTIHQAVRHAEGVSWGILQHAFYTAWNDALAS